jgi:hypothetical protein
VIYQLVVFNKQTNLPSDIKTASDPLDLLKISAGSPYYRYVRHLLSVPGVFAGNTALVLDANDEETAYLLVTPATSWSSADADSIVFYAPSTLQEMDVPSLNGPSLN